MGLRKKSFPQKRKRKTFKREDIVPERSLTALSLVIQKVMRKSVPEKPSFVKREGLARSLTVCSNSARNVVWRSLIVSR